MNPTLSDLVGGISAVTLSDEEARRRGHAQDGARAQGAADVRRGRRDPRSRSPRDPQERRRRHRRAAARLPAAAGDPPARAQRRGHRRSGGGYRVDAAARRRATSTTREHDERERPLSIFPYGVSRNKIERAIANLRVHASIARNWDDADVVLTLKTLERKEQPKLKQIASDNVPIYSIKTNTTTQIQTALARRLQPRLDRPRRACLARGRGSDLSGAARRIRRSSFRRRRRTCGACSTSSPSVTGCSRAAPASSPTAASGSIKRRTPEARRMFVVIEGIEGSGKSTLRRRARRSDFARKAATSLVTREPGGTPAGDAIREIFLEPALAIEPLAEAFLGQRRARAARRRSDSSRARSGTASSSAIGLRIRRWRIRDTDAASISSRCAALCDSRPADSSPTSCCSSTCRSTLRAHACATRSMHPIASKPRTTRSTSAFGSGFLELARSRAPSRARWHACRRSIAAAWIVRD